MAYFSRQQKLAGVVIIILVIIILGYAFDFSFIKSPIQYISQPFVRAGSSIGSFFNSVGSPFTPKKELQEQIDTLKEENIELKKENSILRSIQEEERARNRIQEFLISIEEQGVHAHVVGKSTTEQQLLLIDKGDSNAIKEGYPVITEDGVLIGTVVSVSSQISHVLLITDSTQNIGAKVQNEKSSPGVIRGSFGLSLLLDLIPQDDTLETNQTVVTSAINALIPPNLLIGTITRVDKKEGSVFQQAQVISPIQLERVENVLVIIPRNVNP